MQTVDLTHHFLIAMPGMVDPNFARTLTYICEHNEQGALGIVVNRPIDMTLGDLFERVGLTLNDSVLAGEPVYFGGPVQVDRGFVLHRPLGEWGSTLAVRDGVGFTTSKDILEAVASGGGPGNLLVSLGYAGWAPGQIEEELLQNAWLTVAAEASVIFDLPSEDRFDAAMRILGVNPASLSEAAGHA